MALKQKHIILGVILPAVATLVGMKFYLQYRTIDLYVMRIGPMPPALSNSLHTAEHKIDPVITIESPYATAEVKILPLSEIRHILSRVTSHTMLPVVIYTLSIHSSNSVVARSSTKRMITEYQLVKANGEWTIQSASRNPVHPYKLE
jgi:hypothetical protein